MADRNDDPVVPCPFGNISAPNPAPRCAVSEGRMSQNRQFIAIFTDSARDLEQLACRKCRDGYQRPRSAGEDSRTVLRNQCHGLWLPLFFHGHGGQPRLAEFVVDLGECLGDEIVRALDQIVRGLQNNGYSVPDHVRWLDVGGLQIGNQRRQISSGPRQGRLGRTWSRGDRPPPPAPAIAANLASKSVNSFLRSSSAFCRRSAICRRTS